MAVGGDLTLVGKDMIRLLLGAKWEASGRIFTFFGPGVGAMLIYGTHGWIHVSIGKAERWFRWGVIELAVTVSLFLLLLRWGPVGIAIAWSASFWILIVPAFWYAGRPIQLGIPALLSAIWKYIVASLVAGVSSALIVNRGSFLSALSGVPGAAVRVTLVSLLFFALYLLITIMLYRGFAPIHQVARLSRELVPERWLSKSPPPEAPVADDVTLEPDSQVRAVSEC
jgi:PST family polysaccharide transporter